MRLKYLQLLPLSVLAACGGRGEEVSLSLTIDGSKHGTSNTTLEVPFLQHLVRIESDAERIEVSGGKDEPIEVDSEGSVGVDVPLQVGQNQLQVTLKRGDSSQTVKLSVTRKDFENVTYVKAEEARTAGFFGGSFDASGSKFCATENTENGYRVSIYSRHADTWSLEHSWAVDAESGNAVCRLNGDWLAVLHESLRLSHFDAEQGEWREADDIELLPSIDSQVSASWGKNYLFVLDPAERTTLAYRIGEWSEPEATFALPEGDASVYLSTHEDTLMMTLSDADDGGASLLLARKVGDEWSREDATVAMDGGTLRPSGFALASPTRAFMSFQEGELEGVAQLDFAKGQWGARKVITERGDGGSLGRVFDLGVSGDLVFLSTDDSLAGKGINPPYEGYAYLSGAVFAFERVGDDYHQAAYVKTTYHLQASQLTEPPMLGELFGPFDLGHDFLAVSAINDASNGSGIGADPADESLTATAGALWLFE
jgi:hypothetical protein